MSQEEMPVQDFSEFEDSIICPVCGHEQELRVMPSVNVTLDPEMREKVLSGEIFQFTCDKCGFTGLAGYPFIYEDKETNGGFLIYLEPGCEDREVGIDGDVADQVLLQNMTMRLVTNAHEMKEKIFIFEAGLDDRVIELLKLLAFTKMKSNDDAKLPDELRFTSIEEKEGRKVIAFAAFKKDNYLGVIELPYELYQSCVVTGELIWDYPINECGAVDQKWVLDRLNEDDGVVCENGDDKQGVMDEHSCSCDSCNGKHVH